MEISEYKNIFENENTHFYYVGTHDLVLRFLKKYLSKKTGNTILDAGCGTGAMMLKLKGLGEVCGIDVSAEALRFAKKKGMTKIKKASVTDIPFKDNTFDVVISIDVLYHKQVKSDLTALREFKRILKPGGVLLVKNPAHNWLRGSHDLVIHTKRRYNKSGFEKKLKKSGLQVVKISYINLFFFPLALIKRLLESLLSSNPQSDVKNVPLLINSILTNLYRLETSLLLKTTIPYGLSIIAIAKKST